MEPNHYQASNQQQQYFRIVLPESPDQKVKTDQGYTQDNDQQFLERESIDREKRYLIYKLLNQTEKLHGDYDRIFQTSNKKVKTLPYHQQSNLWDQFSNYYPQQVHFKQHNKSMHNKERAKSNLKAQDYQKREQWVERKKLIEQIENLKQQNKQLRRTIIQINMLSDTYLNIITEIQKDLNSYKVSLAIRDEAIESFRNLDTEKIDIKICVQKEIQLRKQIQRLQIQLQLTNQKLNKSIEDFTACFKDKEKYEEIIFQQECQKKIYKRYFTDFLNLYQKMEDDKERVFDTLIKFRKTIIK